MALVSQHKLNNVVNQRIITAFQQYWKLSCAVVRNGKLLSYSGKSNSQVALVLEKLDLSTRHKILE